VILLDSNALLWVLTSPHKFGKLTKRRLDGLGSAFYSPISTFELHLVSLKRGLTELPRDFAEKLSGIGLYELPFNQASAMRARDFDHLKNSDPFDWMLISQAAESQLDFYTSDQRLLALGFSWIKDSTA
jgi:PIN domain nuclease of toxin-antitoxin system